MKPRTGILIKCTIVMVMMAICFPACSKEPKVVTPTVTEAVIAREETNHDIQPLSATEEVTGTSSGREPEMRNEARHEENIETRVNIQQENKQQKANLKKESRKKPVNKKTVVKKQADGTVSVRQNTTKTQPHATKSANAKVNSSKTARSDKKVKKGTVKKNTKVKKPEAPHRFIALKTNVPLDVVAVQNLALEVEVHKHITIDFPVMWSISDIEREHGVRTITFQPEGRLWMKPAGDGGHFFGLHTHFAWFNLKWDENRYQTLKRPLMGVGISYGYRLPLGRHWGAEFNIGFGYANMEYDTYYNIENGAYIDTRIRNYWGITRTGLSLVYRF